MIALSILAVAIMGTIALLLAVQAHNESSDSARVGTKACQEVAEQLLAMPYASMMAQDGITFVATKIDPAAEIGQIEISDISPPGDPGTQAEIRVRIRSDDVRRKPINVELVTRRTNK